MLVVGYIFGLLYMRVRGDGVRVREGRGFREVGLGEVEEEGVYRRC